MVKKDGWKLNRGNTWPRDSFHKRPWLPWGLLSLDLPRLSNCLIWLMLLFILLAVPKLQNIYGKVSLYSLTSSETQIYFCEAWGWRSANVGQTCPGIGTKALTSYLHFLSCSKQNRKASRMQEKTCCWVLNECGLNI